MFPLSITLVDVHLDWLNGSNFHILKGGLLVILIDYMILLSPFLDVPKMSMSIDSLCKECFPLAYDLNGFSLELRDTY